MVIVWSLDDEGDESGEGEPLRGRDWFRRGVWSVSERPFLRASLRFIGATSTPGSPGARTVMSLVGVAVRAVEGGVLAAMALFLDVPSPVTSGTLSRDLLD